MTPVDCPECHAPLKPGQRFCTGCGAAAVPTSPALRRRARWPFWVFVAAMVVALVGGGSIALLVRCSPDRRNFAADPEAPTAAP